MNMFDIGCSSPSTKPLRNHLEIINLLATNWNEKRTAMRHTFGNPFYHHQVQSWDRNDSFLNTWHTVTMIDVSLKSLHKNQQIIHAVWFYRFPLNYTQRIYIVRILTTRHETFFWCYKHMNGMSLSFCMAWPRSQWLCVNHMSLLSLLRTMNFQFKNTSVKLYQPKCQPSVSVQYNLTIM